MEKTEAYEFIKKCIDGKYLCSVRMKYESEDRYLCPLAVSENYYLAMIQDRMNVDGYVWDRLESIDRARPSDAFANAVAAHEGLFDPENMPPVEIAAPQTFFAFLASEGCPVNIECYAGGRCVCFLLGRVDNCSATEFTFRALSLAGDLAAETQSVPYDAVIRVTFGTLALDKLIR